MMNNGNGEISRIGIPITRTSDKEQFAINRKRFLPLKKDSAGGLLKPKKTGLEIKKNQDFSGGSDADDKKLRKATSDFEAFFIQQLLKVMRKSISRSTLLDGGLTQDIYESMLDEVVAKKVSDSGQTGLSDLIYKDLRKEQEIKTESH